MYIRTFGAYRIFCVGFVSGCGVMVVRGVGRSS